MRDADSNEGSSYRGFLKQGSECHELPCGRSIDRQFEAGSRSREHLPACRLLRGDLAGPRAAVHELLRRLTQLQQLHEVCLHERMVRKVCKHWV